MISIPTLFFFAQAMVQPIPIPTPAPLALPTISHSEIPKSKHRAALNSATPAPSPEVRITLVNAMSVPSIALTMVGTNLLATYPSFPQGTWTGNAPLKTPAIDFIVRNPTGQVVAEKPLKFPPVSSQIVLLTGDLSTTGPAELPPQLEAPPVAGITPWKPNLQFHLYPASLDPKERCRYRVINGMPAKVLILHSIAQPNKPSQQLAILAPGNSAVFVHQPQNLQWEAEIEGRTYPITIEQEEDANNCLIPFFLKNGQPTFIRVFEEQ